jgi:NADPH:quinone reductase-like Zn-dependent oxidoreductase
MKALVQTGYGSAENLIIKEMERPTIKDKEILVRIQTAAIHAGDIFGMRGKPFTVRFFLGFPKPKNYIPGFDLAGIVEEVGKDITHFKPGDGIFGAAGRTCAEYAVTTQEQIVLKPLNLTFEQAAAVPTSAITALLGLRDAGKIKAGKKVLVNGAAGGVGIYAIQIAKYFGAEVTGVCSTRNVEMILSLGANHVIDYTKEDFTKGDQKYDLILDNVANHSFTDCWKVLSPNGKHIPNSGNAGLGFVFKAMILSLFIRKQGGLFFAAPKQPDLIFLKELLESEKIKPVIDSTFKLTEATEAFRYLNKGQVSGKVVIKI